MLVTKGIVVRLESRLSESLKSTFDFITCTKHAMHYEVAF